jgi:septal ring factor EnvC (AmiA/AmiB activator)
VVESSLNSARKPATVLAAVLLMLSLSACDTRNEAAEMDDKLHRAEAAAQKAVAAQQAAEAAAERVRLAEDVDGSNDDANRQDDESQAMADGDSVDNSAPGA